jgi:hypothetical protein
LKVIYTATCMTLAYAAIAARYRGAFWFGFSLAGWAYFLMAIAPWVHSDSSAAYSSRVKLNEGLLTSAIYVVVNNLVEAKDVQEAAIRATGYRKAICHCAITILFALAGGSVSAAMARSRLRGTVPSNDRDTSG